MLSDAVLVEVQAWLSKAENDLSALRLLLGAPDPPYDVVCYHAQQTAEKYLKALLTALGTSFRRTHDLAELVALLPPSSAPRALGDLSELTDAGVASRYPGAPDDYTREVAEDLARQADEVKAAVGASCGPWMPRSLHCDAVRAVGRGGMLARTKGPRKDAKKATEE